MNASSVPFAERLNNFIPKFQSPTVLFVGFFAVNRLIGGLFRKIAIKKPGKYFLKKPYRTGGKSVFGKKRA